MAKDRPLTIRLDAEDFKALEAIAQAERSSVSAIVRRAIVRELDRQRETLEVTKQKRKKKP